MKDAEGFPLKVEVETIQPSVRFSDARKELASEGKRFTSKALRRIRYPDLHLLHRQRPVGGMLARARPQREGAAHRALPVPCPG